MLRMMVKLAAYSLLGVAVYELAMGLMEGPPAAPQRSPGRGNQRRRSGSGGGASNRLRGSNSVSVEGGDGASHRQRVGRGIVVS